MDEDEVLELIGRVYDAALDGSRWNEVLVRLSACFRDAGAVLIHHDLRSTAGFAATCEVNPEALQKYVAGYAALDPYRFGCARLGPGAAFVGEEFITREALRRTEFFNDLSRPYDLVHVAGALVAQRGEVRSFLLLNRRASAGAFSAREKRLLTQLAAHIARAISVHDRIATAEVTATSSAAVLDRLNVGVVLLDGTLSAVLVNRYAACILGEGDGLGLVDRNLQAAMASDTRRLTDLAGAALTPAQISQRAGRCPIARPSGRRSYDVLISPFVTSEDVDAAVRTARVMVIVTDPERQAVPDPRVLALWFGLTDAEAEVASLVAAGLEVEAVAGALGLTLETGRWYLKRLMSKTQTHSRAEFVARVFNGPGVLAFDPGVSRGK